MQDQLNLERTSEIAEIKCSPKIILSFSKLYKSPTQDELGFFKRFQADVNSLVESNVAFDNSFIYCLHEVTII